MKVKSFSFGLLFSLLLLCGCGVNLTSTVKLNKDFSGTRVMSCTFSSRDFHSYFKGSKEDLNKLIKESCPDCSYLYFHLLLTETIRILSIFVFLLLMIIRRKFVIFLIFPQRSLMNMEIPHLFPVLFTKKISHLKI